MLRILNLKGWQRLYIVREGGGGYEHFAQVDEVVPMEEVLHLRVSGLRSGKYGGPYEPKDQKWVHVSLGDYKVITDKEGRCILHCDRSGETVHLFTEADGAGDPARLILRPSDLVAREPAYRAGQFK